MKTPRGALAAAAGIALSRLSGLVRAVVVTNVLGLTLPPNAWLQASASSAMQREPTLRRWTGELADPKRVVAVGGPLLARCCR